MTQEDNSWKELRLTTLVCVALILLQGWYVFLEEEAQNQSFKKRDGPSVAVLKNSEGEIKAKGQGEMVWFVPEAGDYFLNLDSLTTMPGAKATAQFAEGLEIEVGENSLIIFEKDKTAESEGVVRVFKGKIKPKLRAGKKIKIASAFSENVKVITAEKDEELSFVRMGETVEEILPPEQAAPTPITPAEIPREFPTNKKGEDPSKIKTRQKPAKKIPPKKIKKRLSAPKIKKSKIRMKSDKQSFLDKLIPSAHAAEGLRGQMEVDLEWDRVDGAYYYRVQVSEDKNFKKLLIDQRTRDPNMTAAFPDIEKRFLYFRVAALDDEGAEGDFSETEILDLEKHLGVRRIPEPIAEKTVPEPKEKTSPLDLKLSLGVSYFQRTFQEEGISSAGNKLKSVKGKGVIALSFSGFGRFFFKKNRETKKSIFLDAFFSPQMATPNSSSPFQKDKLSASLLQALLGLGNDFVKGVYYGFGPYFSNTHVFKQTGLVLSTEQEWLVGAGLFLGAGLGSRSKFQYTLSLNGVALGALGLDAKFRMNAKIYRGVSLQGDALARFLNQEKFYAGIVGLAYEI